MKKNTINDLEITFIKRISIPMYFLYEIRLKNTGKNKIKYDAKNLLCNSGMNVLHLQSNNIFLDYKLLTSGELKKDEEITGFVAYQKVNIASNQPSFLYDNNKFKVKDKEIKVKKVHK